MYLIRKKSGLEKISNSWFYGSSFFPLQDCVYGSINFIFDVKIWYETGLAGGLGYTNNLLPAAPVGLLGLLLLFQVIILM